MGHNLHENMEGFHRASHIFDCRFTFVSSKIIIKSDFVALIIRGYSYVASYI